ncbi:MAG: hypothetical protein AAFQ04_01435 [Pseudomonadota bacterium]
MSESDEEIEQNAADNAVNVDTDDSETDEIASREWPEIEWSLPPRKEGWIYEVSPPESTRDALVGLLQTSGLFIVGRFPDDHQIAINWLHDCLEDSKRQFATFANNDFDSDDVWPEAELCENYVAEYLDRKESEGDLEGRAVFAQANGPRLSLSPEQRARRISQLQQYDMTMVCLVDDAVVRSIGGDALPVLQIDTLDFAWRQAVSSLRQDARREILDADLEALKSVLDEKQNVLEAIRYRPDRRDDLRTEIQTLLSSGQFEDPAKLCRKAIDNCVKNGPAGETNTRIMQCLGIKNSQESDDSDAPLRLEALEDSQPLEPFATVVFLLWACHQARDEGIKRAEFDHLLIRLLQHLAVQEEIDLDEARERAIANKVKKIDAHLATIATPAKDLLQKRGSLLDNLLAKLNVQTIKRNESNTICYPLEIQKSLNSHFDRKRSYLIQQIGNLEAALRPLQSPERLVREIGRAMFIYQAQDWGPMSVAENRQRFVYWLCGIMLEDETSTRAEIQEHQSGDSEVTNLSEIFERVGARADHFSVSHKKRLLYTRELISGWYDSALRNIGDVDQVETIRGHFSKLVTLLLKELQENKAFPSFWFARQLTEFARNKPELLDIRPVARQTGNRRNLEEIDAFMKCIEQIHGSEGGVELRNKATDQPSKTPAQLHYDVFRFVSKEVSDSDGLASKSITYRWFVVALAYRVVPWLLIRLRQSDYGENQQGKSVTYDVLAQILGEENGIETIVETVLSDAVRNYPRHLAGYAAALEREHSNITLDQHKKRMQHELARLRLLVDLVWWKAADDEATSDDMSDAIASEPIASGLTSDEGRTSTSVTAKPEASSPEEIAGSADDLQKTHGVDGQDENPVDQDQDEQADDPSDLVTKSCEDSGGVAEDEQLSNGQEPEKKRETSKAPRQADEDDEGNRRPAFAWSKEYRLPQTAAIWHAYSEAASPIGFYMLHELYMMLVSSDRMDLADRMITCLHRKTERQDLRIMRAVTLTNQRRLKKLRLSLNRVRNLRRRERKDYADIDRLDAFTQLRLDVVGRLISDFQKRSADQ